LALTPQRASRHRASATRVERSGDRPRGNWARKQRHMAPCGMPEQRPYWLHRVSAERLGLAADKRAWL